MSHVRDTGARLGVAMTRMGQVRDEWYEAITDGLVCLLLDMGQEEVGNRLRAAHEEFRKTRATEEVYEHCPRCGELER